MATRASIAARVQLAGQSIDQSIASICAGLGLDQPEPIPGQYAKSPEIRSAFVQERVASFLQVVANKVGKPAEAPAEPAEPAPDEPSKDEPATDEPEPQFHGKPLSDFDGMTDEEILDIKGIGQKTLEDIRAAQKSAAK